MSEAPQQIAGYRIVRTLGRGGMGTVYLAEQDEPVERRVALKVLRRAMSEDDESSARFLAERHAMGRLDHPNVGRILEAGADDLGRPFFAMEWLDGLPIDEYCDEHRLGIPERLRLFLGVCRGVAHAHRRRLLHRDLKPSNVLVIEVDRASVPKVIDFGVAKGLDQPLGGRDLKTQHILGTPIYTSPEGLRLRDVDLDTRTDVYSLGVLLCELLLGRRPHELADGTLGNFLHRKSEEDPKPPSQMASEMPKDVLTRRASARRMAVQDLDGALQGDLDAIVLKAVARHREARYASAAELAADIERHLRHEPIHARPQTVSYVVSRFVRRNRAAVALAGSLLLAVVLGIVLLTVGLHRTRLAEAQSRADAEAARLAHEQAEAVSTFLSSLFREASPNLSRVGEPTNSADLSAEDLVKRGAARAADELADRPVALRKVQSLLGDVYEAWGQFEESRKRKEEALRLAREFGVPPVQEAELLIELSDLEHLLEDFHSAESSLRSALELIRHHEDGEGQNVARALEARALVKLGRVARSRGDYEGALATLREAQTIGRSLPDLDADTQLSIYTGLAGVAVSQGRPEDAESSIRIADEMARRNLPRNHPRRISVVNHLAVVLAMQGKLEEAHPLFEETLALRSELLGRRHFRVAEALNNLGVLLMDLGRPEESLPIHREALQIRRETLGDDDTMTAWSYDNLGVALEDLGHLEESIDHHRQALAIRESVLESDHPLLARSLFSVGKLNAALADERAAIPALRRSIEIRDAKLPPDHTGNAEAKVRLGALLVRQGDEAGRNLIRDGLAILRAADDEDLPLVLELLRSYGIAPE